MIPPEPARTRRVGASVVPNLRNSRSRLLGTLLTASLVAGCAGTTRDVPPGVSVRAAERGLEIVTWACDDADGALQAALLPYLNAPTPFPPETIERWRLNGLRVFAVPADELERVRERLPLLGVTQRQWLGESPAWITAVGGPSNSRTTYLRVDGHESPIDPGRMGISTRCWISPTRAGEPALRLEICPHHTPVRPKRSITTRPDTGPAAIDTRLAASVLVGEGLAYVFVPANPDAIWGSDVPADPDAAEADAGENSRPEHDASSGSEVEFLGPPTAAIPTLGEALLSTWPPPGHRRPKAIVALVPKVPRDAELFGR